MMPGILDLLSYNTCVVGAIAASTTIAVVLWDRRKTPCSYPPGPKGYPIAGNYFDWPKGKIWEGFTKIAKDHSEWGAGQCHLGKSLMSRFVETDVLHFEVFGSHILVLSKAKPVLELLEKRSAVYSDRVSFMKDPLYHDC